MRKRKSDALEVTSDPLTAELIEIYGAHRPTRNNYKPS